MWSSLCVCTSEFMHDIGCKFVILLFVIIIIIIIKFFSKKVVKCNFTNGKENGVQIIVNNNVYTKLLSRNVIRSDVDVWWSDLAETLNVGGHVL